MVSIFICSSYAFWFIHISVGVISLFLIFILSIVQIYQENSKQMGFQVLSPS